VATHAVPLLCPPPPVTPTPPPRARQFFLDNYNKKHADNALVAAAVHMANAKGVQLPPDAISKTVINDRDDLYIKSGVAKTVADLEAEKQVAADALAAKRAEENAMPLCKHFGCSKRFRHEDNTETSCRYHKSAPIFHECAKWWSCCPEKKSQDFDDFKAVPGCCVGMHSTEVDGPRVMGGSDLREANSAPTKLKSIDDFNAGGGPETEEAKPKKPVTNEEKITALKEALVGVGVLPNVFDDYHAHLCATNNVKDMNKDLWQVSRDFAETLNGALKAKTPAE
jgi:hypothetical protein